MGLAKRDVMGVLWWRIVAWATVVGALIAGAWLAVQAMSGFLSWAAPVAMWGAAVGATIILLVERRQARD
ncbi:hypothetical protein SAMN05421805_1332 [Saccharopolyspora antimicrobica]|uniref:Uncharacterized protein n=1 Tax=Saccharopolyspora antimicrobica TaxID=455193 RepID=A0A1I5LTK8_9PSEU|nr:hypothetical protein ATL45_5732 [Saccharopolyspora antimicrobica]SFP00116.1 hypothetical protein SAMN05421805_1332 [Saccharopolyspora antimicrobica]